MNHGKRRRPLVMTAMIDVIFLLLIFFMVISHFQKPSRLLLQASSAPSSQTITGQQATIVNNQQFTTNQQKLPLSQWSQWLQNQNRRIPLTVYISQSVNIQTLSQLLSQLNQADFEKLTLLPSQ